MNAGLGLAATLAPFLYPRIGREIGSGNGWAISPTKYHMIPHDTTRYHMIQEDIPFILPPLTIDKNDRILYSFIGQDYGQAIGHRLEQWFVHLGREKRREYKMNKKELNLSVIPVETLVLELVKIREREFKASTREEYLKENFLRWAHEEEIKIRLKLMAHSVIH